MITSARLNVYTMITSSLLICLRSWRGPMAGSKAKEETDD